MKTPNSLTRPICALVAIICFVSLLCRNALVIHRTSPSVYVPVLVRISEQGTLYYC